ncbi:hypothetical protein AWM75_01320 [Aerococcus urinaehominis]|uniref:Uncharacterized protein n=1 Tax=Aerococcus urinaehominis TaxID=128944 RepID=A0A0X8FK03_9LACT|nr:hypothetical protein [Aerococcus urinaehominis]AMB98717.1 hypothetical protein AWM75_01320 [Aerococcus urinaehominis]SDL99922.1 protein of unknown function [Aerococcus urinaehominis]
MINIDRAWDYFADSDFIRLIRESNKANQIFLKCPVTNDIALNHLQELASDLMFVAIVESQDDLTACLTYDQINLIGLELVIRKTDSDLLDVEWQGQLTSQGYLVVVNAEKLGADTHLYNNLSDDQALLLGGELAWGQMLKQGANAIITDWPNFLNDYRQDLKK